MPELCPFCKQLGDFRAVASHVVDMDCRHCLIQVRFIGTAADMHCRNPVKVLKYIRDKVQGGVDRPLVTSVDMRR